MTQEEKAQAYDEALKRARKMLNMILDNELLGFPDQIREIFPQLKESKDEKIREEMIRYFTEMKKGGSAAPPYDDCIAYLEKQKEQKPSHKFNVGDTIHCKYDDREFTIKSVDLANGVYKYTKEGCGNDIDYADENFELVEQKPADLSEMMVHKEPYIAPVPTPMVADEQKPEWSEEDEDMRNSCISSIEEAKENRYAYKETDGDTSYDHEITWLKSLRPSWKPSEEQMETLKKALYINPASGKLHELKENEVCILQSLLRGLEKL